MAEHTFHALAFVENFSLKELAARYPEAKRTPHQLWYPAAAGGTVYLFPSGALVFHDVGQAGREAEVLRLRRALPKLSDAQVLDRGVLRARGRRARVPTSRTACSCSTS